MMEFNKSKQNIGTFSSKIPIYQPVLWFGGYITLFIPFLYPMTNTPLRVGQKKKQDTFGAKSWAWNMKMVISTFTHEREQNSMWNVIQNMLVAVAYSMHTGNILCIWQELYIAFT